MLSGDNLDVWFAEEQVEVAIPCNVCAAVWLSLSPKKLNEPDAAGSVPAPPLAAGALEVAAIELADEPVVLLEEAVLPPPLLHAPSASATTDRPAPTASLRWTMPTGRTTIPPRLGAGV